MNTVQKIDISSSTIFRVVLILLSLWFLYLVRDLLLVLIAAIVVASAIEPLANKVQKQYKVPRAVSVIGIYLMFVALIVLAFALIVPALVEQTVQLAHALPQIAEGMKMWLGNVAPTISENAVSQLQDGLTRFSNQIANIGVNVFQQTRNVFSGALSVLFVFIIAFYLVIEENALFKFFRHIVPKEHMKYVEHVLSQLEYKIGRWVLGQLALAIAIGVISSVGLWLMGVPYALALGLLAGLMEIIPVIGPIIAAIPAIFVGISQSLFLGLGVLVFYILLQQFENNVLVPNIMKKATGLNPLVTLLAVLLGARLAGIAGAILSVPVATILSIIVSDFFDSGDAKRS